jgi:hypothetical protein
MNFEEQAIAFLSKTEALSKAAIPAQDFRKRSFCHGFSRFAYEQSISNGVVERKQSSLLGY